MQIQIKFRWSDKILFEGEYNSTKECLSDAVLRGAVLRGADLSGAVLSDAVLSGAVLSGADLSGADLRGADLRNADLRDAVLRSADLRGADLRGADLSGADLSGADLDFFRSDLIAEILKLPGELEMLRDALTSGKIDGSTYSTKGCSCLAGSIAKNRGIESVGSGSKISENGLSFIVDSSSPRELWFANISEGDTPETNQCCKFAHDWICEAIAIRDHIRATALAD